MSSQQFNVSQYLLHRLHQLGSTHLFGVCGDVVLGFMEQVVKGPVKQINCCNELNAAYAADGYARLHGLGTVVTTFTVGSLSGINAIGGSFAEHVPVVMITGTPERHHAKAGRMLHHTLGTDYSIARQMFSHVTVASEYLDDPERAPQQIDSALSKCLYYKKPIYLELPADMVVQKCDAPGKFIRLEKNSSADALTEAVQEACHLLTSAKRPLILLGWEIIRHGLQEQVKKLVEKTGYPYSVFPTAKTVLSEDHPQFIGIYQGNWSREAVKKQVDEADCVLMLGAFLIDSDTGGFTAKLDKKRLIESHLETTVIKQHIYHDVMLHDFIQVLTEKLPAGKTSQNLISAQQALQESQPYSSQPKAPLTVKRFFKRIQSFLQPRDIVVVDVGECLYSTSGLLFPANATYISQAFYNSIGYSVGAALGASTDQSRRTLLFVGDGSFQIGAQEIATMIHSGSKAIVFLLNNDGYGIERAIYDGPYNDLSPWRYHLLPQALGGEPGLLVTTEGELEKALEAAEKADRFTFIEIQVDKFDFGDTLRKAGAAMAESSKNSYESK